MPKGRNARHPELEPYLKFLTDTYGITPRCQRLAMARAVSPPRISAEEILRAKLENAKKQRKVRDTIVSTPHRWVCEVVGEHFGVDTDAIVDGVLDDDYYVMLLDQFVQAGSRMQVLFSYDWYSHPPLSSGRHVVAQKDKNMLRCTLTDGTDVRLQGKLVAAYKLGSTKDLDMRSIQEVYMHTCFYLFSILEA